MHSRHPHLKPAIFHLLELVPKGYVLSYGQIGKVFGISPRQVGQILHQNDNPEIPCYKVVKADKTLASGYKFGGTQEQAKRLKQEGIEVVGSEKDISRTAGGSPYKVNAPFWQIPQLLEEYLKLYAYFGPANLWPWDPNTPQTNSPEEIIIGAVLTQNTTWKNVEKALNNLREHLGITARTTQRHLPYIFLTDIVKIPTPKLEQLIRPAGYFRQKARYLKNVAYGFAETKLLNTALSYAWDHFNNKKFRAPTQLTTQKRKIRRALLNIKGVGPETADDILTYALLVPSFVVDAYLRRFITSKNIRLQNTTELKNSKESRQKLLKNYHELQRAVEEELAQIPQTKKLYVYQQFHALVVLWGKTARK